MEARWDDSAARRLTRLRQRDEVAAGRIERAVALYASSRLGDVRKLRGLPGRYRLRVGDWRVVCSIDRTIPALVVLDLDQRKDVYRGG